MDMLDKSQRIAQSSQLASQQEKSEVEEQQRRLEENLKSQVSSLKKENTVLRSEMDRLRKCSGCTGDLTLRSKLLQEIERLEASSNTKESKLQFQHRPVLLPLHNSSSYDAILHQTMLLTAPRPFSTIGSSFSPTFTKIKEVPL
jgi:hypothetical protein